MCCSARTRLQWGARAAAVQAVDSLSCGCYDHAVCLCQQLLGSAVACKELLASTYAMGALITVLCMFHRCILLMSRCGLTVQ